MKLVRLLLLGLILVLVAMASALTAMRFAIHGREVSAPNLKGLPLQAAEQSARRSGLVVDVEDKFYSREIPVGYVLSQQPQAGTTVRKGLRIRVAQSLGPRRVPVPDLSGETERAAQINIQRRGLELKSVARVPMEGVEPGTVVAQSPPPNSTEASAPKVSLLVAAPPPDGGFVMPSFVGRKLGEAQAEIEAAGFVLGTVVDQSKAVASASPAAAVHSSDPLPASAAIVKQYPAAGQRIMKGDRISFEVLR